MNIVFGLFWTAIAALLYIYILFPFLVYIRGLISRSPYQSKDHTPSVSLIIAAYNEVASIGGKLDNVLELDYPREQFDVVVASDGSDDGTNEIVKDYEKHGIRLLALPRQGKAPALNAAVAATNSEVIVFSDANSMYAPDAIRALVRPFADPTVGGVAGNQCYLSEKGSGLSGDGEKSYWNFDRFLKRSQSRAGNVISATGAIYAIRRKLFQTVPDGVTDDFVTSTRVIAQGYRLVFAPDAAAYEPVASSGRDEFGRKVRVMTRGLRAVLMMKELLNPFQHGFYAIQLFSHKVLRRLAVFPLILLFVTNLLLWNYGLFYQLLALAQLGFYGLALGGIVLGDTSLGRSKIFTLPFFFCMVNFAALKATWNVLRGNRIDRWETNRQDASHGALAP